MFEKSGKFYADRRDRKGVRKRKAFTTERAALKHEEEEKPSGMALKLLDIVEKHGLKVLA